MKKILLLILATIFSGSLYSKEIGNFKLINKTDNQYIINFSIDDIEIESVGEYKKIISSSKGLTSEIGMPELPLFTALFEVGIDDEYQIEYEVKSSRKINNIKILTYNWPIYIIHFIYTCSYSCR